MMSTIILKVVRRAEESTIYIEIPDYLFAETIEKLATNPDILDISISK